MQSVSRFGFGDGKTKAQSSVYLTYPVSAGITVTNSPASHPIPPPTHKAPDALSFY